MPGPVGTGIVPSGRSSIGGSMTPGSLATRSSRRPKLRFEGAHERQTNQVQFDGVDDHVARRVEARGCGDRSISLPVAGLFASRSRGPRDAWCASWRGIYCAVLEFRHLAIDGPPGVGKSVLADRLGTRLDAAVVLDDTDNPFLAEAYGGRTGAAFQAQLFSLLSRHRQQRALRQGDLFNQILIADYLFDKDKIYAYVSLDDNELFIYQRLYDLLSREVPPPDLVIYLQAPPELVWKRLKQHLRRDRSAAVPDEPYVREVIDAFNHFFFHYQSSPLLVVETSHVDLGWPDVALDDILRQINSMTGGTRYFVPREK
jgi:deoxyadenosine/deoxycytidine kinase